MTDLVQRIVLMGSLTCFVGGCATTAESKALVRCEDISSEMIRYQQDVMTRVDFLQNNYQKLGEDEFAAEMKRLKETYDICDKFYEQHQTELPENLRFLSGTVNFALRNAINILGIIYERQQVIDTAREKIDTLQQEIENVHERK